MIGKIAYDHVTDKICNMIGM